MNSSGQHDARRLIGQVVAGRYRVEALIGEGGMGAVYRAAHVDLNTPLALKVLHAEMLEMDEIVERFQREAIAGAHINHPNVAAATDSGQLEDGSQFLVLEYLDGRDLRSVIAEGPLLPRRALAIARQVALALRASHTLGIVHRDLKPENVMLLAQGGVSDVVKVLDFGIAKVPVDELAGPRSKDRARVLTQLGMVYGTPEYIAPEQAMGHEIDGRADLYALGVILYEMLAGERPFDAPDRAALLALKASGRPPPLAVGSGDAARELEALVHRLLEPSREKRFPDAALVAQAIELVSTRLDSSMPERSGPPMREPRSPAPTRVSQPEPKTVAYGRAPMVSLVQADLQPAWGSLPVTFGAIGIVAIVVMVAGAVVLRSDDTVKAMEAVAASTASPTAERSAEPAPQKPPPGVDAAANINKQASPGELEAAKPGGLATLTALAQKYPSDPAVLKALLLAHTSDRSTFAAAMGVAKRLFELSPPSANDDDVKQVVLMAANGTPDAAGAAFDVMTTMGHAGPDLLYELVLATNVGKLPKERATTLLADPEMLRKATPALRIANDLRLAQACQRKPLLRQAREDGDARALHYLKPLAVTTGCGFLHRSDCYGCLGNRKELKAAISAIEARLTKEAR